MSKRSPILDLFTLVAVLLTLIGHLLRNPPLAYLCKPLATLLILYLAFSHWRISKSSYPFWVFVGLCFSLLGDIALLWPTRYFLPGLLAFLLTNIAYLISFTRGTIFPAKPSVWPPYFAIVLASLAFLLPTVPAPMKVPVALYSMVLASMAAQAMGRCLLLKTRPACLAAIGAMLFMLSDLLLAFDHFRSPLPLAPLLVLLPYYLAQWLIAYATASF